MAKTGTARGKVHMGFAKLRATLAASGVRNPGGLARSIGIKKYGAARYAAMTAAGRRKAATKRRARTK